MANVAIEGLTKRFGARAAAAAIDHLDLEVEQGEFLVLLGPSGCGKTTTLRCVAGLERADAGTISFGDRVMFDPAARRNVAPNKRNVGMVFQSYALWPHMTVRKNIGYPLRIRRVARETAKQWIEDVAGLVDCSHLLDRYPSQLSGGQQQRIALARGLVARPDLVLFDEPLSNLDARLRDQVRTEIHELHERLQFTAIYVTHDQVEALALGDRLAIMRDGTIEQLGEPELIFERPATDYVADFIGMRNRFQLARSDGRWIVSGVAAEGEVSMPGAAQSLVMRARPEDVEIAPPDTPPRDGTLTFPAAVADSEFAGRWVDVVATAGDTRILSKMPAGQLGEWVRRLHREQPVQVAVRLDYVTFYDERGTLVSPNGYRRGVLETLAGRAQ